LKSIEDSLRTIKINTNGLTFQYLDVLLTKPKIAATNVLIFYQLNNRNKTKKSLKSLNKLLKELIKINKRKGIPERYRELLDWNILLCEDIKNFLSDY
jgi:hypothetical protein